MTSPLVSVSKIINLSTDEVVSGLVSGIIYIAWMSFIAFCFKKAEQGRKNKSRIDKVVEEASNDGRVNLPEKSFSPEEPHP